MTERQRELLTLARDELKELVSKSEETFEKQLSYIAGGGLALSFVLVEKLIGDVHSGIWPWLLYCGWFTLATCLLVNLWSQKIASDVHSANKAEIDTTLMLEDDVAWHAGCYNQERCEKRKVSIGKWNRASILLLFGGIILILVFTIINLAVHKSPTSKPKTESNFENKFHQSMSKSNDTIAKPFIPDQTRGLTGSALPAIQANPQPNPQTGQVGSTLPSVPSTPVKK